MNKDFTLAITGDSIIRTRLSINDDESFLSLVKVIRDADAAYTQLEVVVHDFDGPEVYPAAEAGHNWSRAADYVVDELKWAGFDILSTASNHSLDFSYGGLISTLKACKEAGVPQAGMGMNLAEAREPAYFDSPRGRVGLVSMCSSFVGWSRAGDATPLMKGRPGVNPLRFHHVVNKRTAEAMKQLAFKMGCRIYQHDNVLLFTQSGVENTMAKFVVKDEVGEGIVTEANEQDTVGNLRSIAVAREKADYVIAQLHSHDFHPEKGVSVPPHFVPPLARRCLDGGADVFVAQGCHAPLRGIEIYNGKPIFYETGDFILSTSAHITRLPSDYYQKVWFSGELSAEDGEKALHEFDKSGRLNPPRNPSPVGKACVVPVCTFGEGRKLKELKLYAATFLDEPASLRGLPVMANAEAARKIIAWVAELSAPFGTKIDFRDGVGIVRL